MLARLDTQRAHGPTRLARCFAIVLPLGAVFGAAPPAPAAERWCATGSLPPCVNAATVDGLPVGPTHPQYLIDTSPVASGGSTEFLWSVEDRATGADLGSGALAQDWAIEWSTGAVPPRVSFVRGGEAGVVRTETAGNHSIEIRSSPVYAANNSDCDQSSSPWTCPDVPEHEFAAYLAGQVTDYGSWDDVPQRLAFDGMDFATNVALTSVPPEIVGDPATGASQLRVPLASHHFLGDGTTVFEGRAEVRIPNAFLKAVYEIDDPATLTSAGLATSGTGGGTAVVTQAVGGGAMRVEISGVTFSQRNVKIGRGRITPSAPRALEASRTSATRGRLVFETAEARGSKIAGYQARCRPPRGPTATADSRTSPLRVSGLERGTHYKCSVRADSEAGLGRQASAQLSG